jgi:hypothetical protein
MLSIVSARTVSFSTDCTYQGPGRRITPIEILVHFDFRRIPLVKAIKRLSINETTKFKKMEIVKWRKGKGLSPLSLQLLTVKKSVLAEIVRAVNIAESFRIGAPPKNYWSCEVHKVSSLICATFYSTTDRKELLTTKRRDIFQCEK